MRKIFTFLTLIFFTTNTLVWGAPADAVSLLAGNSHAKNGLSIVHIQDAHSNYEAQKNIQEILKNLHEKEGYEFVALEGAWQPLAPEVYHFFPDAKSNLKVADFLAQKGEMSGAELYALELAEKRQSVILSKAKDLHLKSRFFGLRPQNDMVFEGVEDPKVFREDYELFKKGLAAQDEVKKYCDNLFAKLDLEKSRIYSPEFLRFDRNVRDYENKRLELSAFLRIIEKSTKEKLQIELISPDHQREWPYLCRMLRVMNALQGLDMEAVKKDAVKLGINLEDKTLAANPRAFFESVYADSVQKRISLDGYKALRQYSEYVILKSEITGPELFAELDTLIEKLSDVYAVSEKEKELLAHSRQARLLEKLLKYEATGKDWSLLSSRTRGAFGARDPGSRSTQVEPVKTLDSGLRRNDKLVENALRFYQLAERRNQILFENTLAKIKSRGVKKAILITGGFHSDGIESLAKQKNISYRTIQPQIHEEFSNQRYRDAVLGTWRKEIAQSKIPKPEGMVKEPYDSVEHAEIIELAIACSLGLDDRNGGDSRIRDAERARLAGFVKGLEQEFSENRREGKLMPPPENGPLSDGQVAEIGGQFFSAFWPLSPIASVDKRMNAIGWLNKINEARSRWYSGEVVSVKQLTTDQYQKGISRDFTFNLDGSRFFAKDFSNRRHNRSHRNSYSLFNALTGEPILYLEPADKVLFSPDGSRLLVFREDGNSQLFDAMTGKLLRNLGSIPEDSRNYKFTFSPDGSRLFLWRYKGKSLLVNVVTGRNVLDLGDGVGVRDLNESRWPLWRSGEFSPDGKRFFVLRQGGRSQLLDAETGKEIRNLGYNVHSAEFGLNGRRLIVCRTEEHRLSLLDSGTGEEIVNFSNVSMHGFSHQRDSLLYASLNGRDVVIINAENGETVFDLGRGSRECLVWQSPDGTRLIFYHHASRTFQLWDMVNKRIICSFDGPSIISCDSVVWFSKDGRRLLIKVSGVISQLIDSENGKVLRDFGNSPLLDGIWFGKDGSRVFLRTLWGNIGVFNAEDGSEIINDETGRNALVSSDEGKLVVTHPTGEGDDSNQKIRIFNVATGEVLSNLEIRGLVGFVLSPDGSRLVTVDDKWENILLLHFGLKDAKYSKSPYQELTVTANSLGAEPLNEKFAHAKRLHAELFNKTISLENRRKIAEEFIQLDSSIVFQDSSNARSRVLDAIVRSSTPEEASERLKQLSAVLCAEAETEIQKTEALGYKRDPDAILLGQAGYRTHLLSILMTDPVRYLEESENPNLVRAGQYFAIAGVLAVTFLAFVNLNPQIAKLIMGLLVAGVFGLFLASVVYSIFRTLVPAKEDKAFDWENIFGPNDLVIFNEFRRSFWHGDYDFSTINLIENVSLRLGLISEVANAQEKGTFVDAEEGRKFKVFLEQLRNSEVPRLASFAEKLLEDKFQDDKDKIEKPRLAEGASLGKFDPLEEFEKELKKKWEDFFYQTARLGMELSGEDHKKFLKLRKARLAFLYYALIEGRSYDKFFWDWRALPDYFTELPVKYHTVRTVEWLNLVFPGFTPAEVHSEEAAQERTDFLQQALQEIESHYTEFLKFRFHDADTMNLIQQAVSNALPDTFLRALEERGEDDVLGYIYFLRGHLLKAIGVAEKSNGAVHVIKMPAPNEIRPETITLYETGEINLPWDPAIHKKSIFSFFWSLAKKMFFGVRRLLAAFSLSRRAIQEHHQLFLNYLELLRNREAIGMPQLHFGTAWSGEDVNSFTLEEMMDGFKQNSDFVVKAIDQVMNTRDVSHRTYIEAPDALKQKLLAGNTNIEISNADLKKIKLYHRQIGELKEAIQEEKIRQQQWQAAKAKSLGEKIVRQAKIFEEAEMKDWKKTVEEALSDLHEGIVCVGPFILVNAIKSGFIVQSTTMLEYILPGLIARLEHRLKSVLREAFDEIRGNIIYVSPSHYILSDPDFPLSIYALSMLQQMAAHAGIFSGARVIDLGAGDGLLSRAALALGARHAVLVDKDGKSNNLAKVFLRYDGRKETSASESGYLIYEGDINGQKFDEWAEAQSIRKNASIVLANIGPWDVPYGDTNRVAMEKTSNWPAVSLILNGGYLYFGNFPHAVPPAEGIEHRKAYENMRAFLGGRGFKTSMSGVFTAGTLIASKVMEQNGANAGSLGLRFFDRSSTGKSTSQNPQLINLELSEEKVHDLAEAVNLALDGGFLSVHKPLEVSRKKFAFETDQTFDHGRAQSWSRVIRIGPLIFVFLNPFVSGPGLEKSIKEYEQVLTETLGETYTQNRGNVFFFDFPVDHTQKPEMPLSPYTRTMIFSMLAQAEKFKDAVVADFGAGDGLLSRIALGLGAKKVILIEKEEDYLDTAKTLLNSGGWKEGIHYAVLHKDLTDADFDQSAAEYGLDQASVALMNIGPWEKLYDNANQVAYVKAMEWPRLNLLINGGFLFSQESHRNAFYLLEETLKLCGFKSERVLDHNMGVLTAVRADSLGKKISERFQAPRFSEGISKDKAWIIFNLVVFSPNFLEETNKKLKLGLGNRPVKDFYVERIPSNNKDIYKIRIVVDGGSTAGFILYAIQTEKIWNAIVNGYEKGAEFNRLNPGFRLFPKVGAVRLNHEMHWVSAEYVVPYFKLSEKKKFRLTIEAYFRLLKAGWTLTDLYLDQVMITRPGKKIQAKVIDLDYLRHLSTKDDFKEDLSEQVRKIFHIARQDGGKEEIIEVARIGKRYLPAEIVLEGFRNFSKPLKGFRQIPSEDEIKTTMGMSLGSKQNDAEVLADLKKLFKDASPSPEFSDLIDSIQLEDLKYPKDGLIVSGDQLRNKNFSSKNLYGISIPEDANGFSGDILEAYIQDNALHLIVADAVGHDLAASFNRYLFQSLTRKYPLEQVDQIFRDWHIHVRLLMQEKKEDKDWPFLFFGLRYFELRMNLADGKVSVRTATGVNDQLVEGPKGEMNQLEVLGPGASEHMIGMMTGADQAAFPWRELILNKGFLILLQTDGAYEARNGKKPTEERELGLERIKSVINEVISKNRQATAKAIIERIMVEVKSHLGDEPISDDITLLAFRVPNVAGASLGAEDQLKKFEAELIRGKVPEVRLKEMVDWAENQKKFPGLRKIFTSRLLANENDFAAKRGLGFLNAREAEHHEFRGLIASVASMDGGHFPVRAVAVSPDAHLFASGNENGLVKVWDIETGQLRYRFEEPGYEIKSLRFSENSRKIEAIGTNLSSRVWIFNTGQKIKNDASVVMSQKYITFDNRPLSLKNPDSKRGVELDARGNVKVWDWNDKDHLSSKMVYEIVGKDILSIDISSDNRFFATGSRDGRVIVWDFGTREPRQVAFLGGNRAAVYSIKFSPDGGWLVSGSADYSVKLWPGHGRKLDGFWQKFKLGFELNDAEKKAIEDRIKFLGEPENRDERSILEAYAENWQKDLAEMVPTQARKLAAEPNRDPKWKNDPIWLQDALTEFLHSGYKYMKQKEWDKALSKLLIIEDEMRKQLDIPYPRPQTNTYWNDGQNILLVLELLRSSKPIINLSDPVFPQTSGLSLGIELDKRNIKFSDDLEWLDINSSLGFESPWFSRVKKVLFDGRFDYLRETIQKLNLNIGIENPIKKIQIEKIHQGFKGVYKIGLTDSRGKKVDFILYEVLDTRKDNYLKASQFNDKYPRVRVFPRIGAMRPSVNHYFFLSVEYIKPLSGNSLQPIRIRTFLRLFKHGWTIADLGLDQVIVTRLKNGGKIGILVDLDLLTEIKGKEDLKKQMALLRQFSGRKGRKFGSTGKSLGAAETFAGGIYPFWMYTSALYPEKPKAVVVSGGFSVTVKADDHFNLHAEREYLREHPRSVSVVLDRTGRIQEKGRLIVLPVKPGQEAEAIRSLLSGKDFTRIAKLARKLYEKPVVRLTQSAIHKRITIEASSDLLAQIGLTGAVQLLEIPAVNELSSLKINPHEFSAYALVHAASLGRVEGNLNDPLMKPFRANIERDPVTGIYRIVRNSLADRIAALETSLDVSRKILAAA